MASLNECMEKRYFKYLLLEGFQNLIVNIDKLWHGIEVENSLIRNLWCKRRKTDAQQRWCVSGVTNIMSDAQSDEATQHIRPLHEFCLKMELTKKI